MHPPHSIMFSNNDIEDRIDDEVTLQVYRKTEGLMRIHRTIPP